MSPTFFQLRLEFCYGQEKQLVFVQAFSKINKVSIDYFLCSQFKRNPINNNSDGISELSLTQNLQQISVEFLESPQPFLEEKKREREMEKCEMRCIVERGILLSKNLTPRNDT